MFSVADHLHMARALKLAELGRFTARPNPMVGCVLVRDGAVIGEGWHATAGSAHAEINALRDAGDASGATAYVTLEPCAHHGKTPPCTEALIEAGIAEVVAAVEDPNPEVNGQGLARLRAAGIKVRSGLMEQSARALNRGFFTRVITGKPFLRIKIAASLDGALAMRGGESQWITGPESRRDVQRLRAVSGAVMSGIGTVLADDPSFTVRESSIDTGGMQPWRVIVDTHLRMPLSAGMLCLPGRTLVYCVDDAARPALEDAGADVVQTAADGDTVDLNEVLLDLGRQGVNDLLVEAGPALSGSLVSADLADELVIYQAPHIMGSETISMFHTPAWTALADRRGLDIVDTRRIGADTRITARFRRQP